MNASKIAVGGAVADIQDTEARRAGQLGDFIYTGVDLTAKFAADIAGFPTVWDWIKARIKAANYIDIHVGDYIPFTCSNGYKIKAEIAGIDTYYNYGDSPVGHHIDFISKDCWPDTHVFNPVNFNNGTTVSPSPWLASDLYAWMNSLASTVPNAATADPALLAVNYVNAGVLDKLPAALQAAIVPKRFLMPTRYTAGALLTDDNYYLWGDMGKLWIPYEIEVFGRDIWGSQNGWSDHGMQQYAVFAHNMKRVKGAGDGGGRAAWWLASARGGSSTAFTYATSVGNSGGSGVATDTGIRVALGFRIA